MLWQRLLHLTNHKPQTINQKLLHQFVQNKKYCRAKSAVFERQLLAAEDHVLVGVGEAGAVGGTDLVNGAEIILTKEGAGSGAYYKIAVFIYFEVGIYQLAFAKAQVAANAFDVGCFEAGRIILAAGGAGKTVYLPECFFMQLRKLLQHLVLVGALQELPELLLPVL